MRRRGAGPGGSISNEMNAGSTYTDEEREFLVAIDRYKRRNNRPFPTWIEVLDVLRGLGWRKGDTASTQM